MILFDLQTIRLYIMAIITIFQAIMKKERRRLLTAFCFQEVIF